MEFAVNKFAASVDYYVLELCEEFRLGWKIKEDYFDLREKRKLKIVKKCSSVPGNECETRQSTGIQSTNYFAQER